MSTLIIAAIVWIAGVATAEDFGNLISSLAGVALIGFGGWIAISSLWDTRRGRREQTHAQGHKSRARARC